MADRSDAEASGTPPQTPRLHILQLHESPHQDDNYERYSHKWILDVADTAETPVREGDMLYMPDLLSGAGELEGLRFVGHKTSSDSTQYELLKGGIESPVFPRDIAQGQSPSELRQKYEGLLEMVLQQQGMSLADLFGGADIVQEFWENPDVERGPPRETEQEWHIPLQQCTILSTHTSSSS